MGTVGVVGASGFAGAELLRLLVGHPELEVAWATGDSQAGTPVASLYPHLAGAYAGRSFDTFAPAMVDGVDVVFLALPHGASGRLMAELDGRAGLLLDVAADFRLHDPGLYRSWYGEE